ncbi:MAG: PilZ domain-containing protein [Acidobacteria bacterium]|nr:PilZ domain-containing protein [Acidobacteriota bacterium]
MNSQGDRQDLRSMRRFAMQLPVQVKLNGRETLATTRDVSARGVYILTDHDGFASENSIEFTLTLPPEITMTQCIRVSCSGRVIRVEADPRGKFGVAALIDHYRFLDSSEFES